MAKKYASLTTLSNFLDNLKNLFATKSDVNSELAKKANSSHNHDDCYYTENEINTKYGNVENKSSATIRAELTKENVTTALGYTPPTTDTTYSSITNDEIDEVCGGTIMTFLDSISVEGVSF